MATCIFVKNNDWKKKKDYSASAFLDFNMEVLQSSLQIAQAVGGVSHFLVCLQLQIPPSDGRFLEWMIYCGYGSTPISFTKTHNKQTKSFEWSHLRTYLTNSEVLYATVSVSRCLTRRRRLRCRGDSFKRYNYVITKKKVTLHSLHQR